VLPCVKYRTVGLTATARQISQCESHSHSTHSLRRYAVREGMVLNNEQHVQQKSRLPSLLVADVPGLLLLLSLFKRPQCQNPVANLQPKCKEANHATACTQFGVRTVAVCCTVSQDRTVSNRKPVCRQRWVHLLFLHFSKAVSLRPGHLLVQLKR